MEREGLGDMVLHQAYQEGGMGMVASPTQPHPLPHDHVFVLCYNHPIASIYHCQDTNHMNRKLKLWV